MIPAEDGWTLIVSKISTNWGSFSYDAADDALKSEVKAAVEKARPALDSDSVDTIKAAKTELEATAHKLAEVMYKKAQAEGGAAGDDGASPGGGASSAGGKPGGDDVVDADFEEVKP